MMLSARTCKNCFENEVSSKKSKARNFSREIRRPSWTEMKGFLSVSPLISSTPMTMTGISKLLGNS